MLALLFPGQGSQSPRMAKEIIEFYPTIRTDLLRMSQILDMDILHYCDKVSAEKQRQTDVAQVVVFALSIAIYNQIFATAPKRYRYIAGHSLGHFTALTAAGAMDIETALKVVQLRGDLMNKAARECDSGMLVVTGIERPKLEDLIFQDGGQTVWISNINSAKQITVSGLTSDLKIIQGLLRRKGVNAKPLDVAGGFHSPIFDGAAQAFAKHLHSIDIKDPQVPILRNKDGKSMITAQDVRQDIETHMVEQVNWQAIVQQLAANGMHQMIEVGPGRILKGLMLVHDREIEVKETNKPKRIETVISSMLEEISV